MQKTRNTEAMTRLLEIHREHLELSRQINELIEQRIRLSNERIAIYKAVNRDCLTFIDLELFKKAMGGK